MAVKEKFIRGLDVTGLSVFEPVVRLLSGEDPQAQFRAILRTLVAPVLAFGLFLVLWSAAAQSIVTKYGTLPTPAQVWAAAANLVSDHQATRAKEFNFYKVQETKAQKIEAAAVLYSQKAESLSGDAQAKMLEKVEAIKEKAASFRTAKFSSSPTYLDQIFTSLKTVFAGFLVASLIAIPLGVFCGMSPTVRSSLAPMIQIFKPVSPLAWLPIVMIVVGALYTTKPSEAWFEKSFISSALTVALCSLWPTLTNTALGVASIEKDHMNVARVLNLGFWTRIRRIVIPSSLPLMFAGLRISLGVGWMVLIAAEMLAQNPGLGKFVWDMFQNGSSQTLAQIMVAVFTIGIIGFLLDRCMVALQKSVSFDSQVSA
jgi:nitrate/nitrite transport system permease protein